MGNYTELLTLPMRNVPGLHAHAAKVWWLMDLPDDQDTSSLLEDDSPPSLLDSVRKTHPHRISERRIDVVSGRVPVLGAAGFFAAISWQVVIPFLPLHLSRVGFTAAQIGLLVSIFSLATAIVEFETGRIAGAVGRRRTLVWGFLGNCAAMVWLAQARTWSSAGGALAAVGAFRAMMWVPLFAAVADTASAQTRGRAFGSFWFWTSVAFLTGPALGGFVVTRYGDVSAFYVGSAFSLLAVPALIAATNPSRPTSPVTVTGAEKVLAVPAVLQFCTANLLYYSVTGIWMTFLPLYAARQGISVLTVGWVFTVQGLTYALIQIPIGRLVDRWGPERLFIPALVGRSMVAALAPLLHTPSALLLGGAVFGLAGGFLPVPLTTIVARLVPREHYTAGMGVYNSSGDLGNFLGPLLGGAAALLGLLAPFVLCLPLGIAGVTIGLRGAAAAERSARASL
jgi:MFS family permease